jgi:TPR repeat protein
MLQISKQTQQHTNNFGAMETGDHSKNGASLKSLTSRKNIQFYLFMKRFKIQLLVLLIVGCSLNSYSQNSPEYVACSMCAGRGGFHNVAGYQTCLYCNGTGKMKNPQRYIEDAAKQGQADAEEYLRKRERGEIYDPAKQGQMDAEVYLGVRSKIEGKYTNAFTSLLKAANYGIVKAMYEVAELYELGLGTAQNLTVAKKWYTKAYENGFELASVGIAGCDAALSKETAAKLYDGGQLFLKKAATDGDYKLTLYCFRLAALKGNADAAMIVGNIYLKQVVTEPRDWGVDFMMRAQRWYKLAGRLGKNEGTIVANNLEKSIDQGLAISRQYVNEMMKNNLGSSEVNSSGTSKQTSGFCSLCNGTGKYMKGYSSDYTGNTAKTWCNICSQEMYPHYHDKCPSCNGTGRK